MAWGRADATKGVEVRLPTTFSTNTMYSIIEAMLDPTPQCRHGLVILNFSKLARIRPGGVAILSNLIEATQKAAGAVHFTGVTESPALEHLRGAGFLAHYGGTEYDERITGTVHSPLRLVEYSASPSHISMRLIPWLADILGTEPRALASIRVCFEEVYNNIRDHSTVQIGCCCGYYDQEARTVTICISDFGVGIPKNVIRYLKREGRALNDHEAIGVACQPGFSTRTTPGNMGAGLPILIRNVVVRNRGLVHIHSDKGVATFAYNPSSKSRMKVDRRPCPPNSFYPGTMVYVMLNVKTFVPDAVEEPFEWGKIRLLDFVPRCYNSDDGQVILRLLQTALESREPVTISFAGVDSVPSSFVNAAFIPLLQTFTFAEIRKMLRFADTNSQINEMIRTRFAFEAQREKGPMPPTIH